MDSSLIQHEAAEREQRSLAGTLNETALALAGMTGVEEAIDRILLEMTRVSAYDAANILMLEGSVARVVGCRGYAERGLETTLLGQRYHVPDFADLREMAATGEPCIYPDVQTQPDWVFTPASRWVRSYAGVPILAKGRLIGFLGLLSAVPNFYTSRDAPRLQVFAAQAAVALDNSRLLAGAARRGEQFALVSDLSSQILRLGEPKQILGRAAQRIVETFGYYHFAVYMVEGSILRLEATSSSVGDVIMTPYVQATDTGLLGYVASTGQPLLVPDVLTDPRYVPHPDLLLTRCELTVPLRQGPQVIGVLDAQSMYVGGLDELDRQALEMVAAQLAQALENARLYAEARQQTARLNAIHELNLALGSVLQVDALLAVLYTHIIVLMPVDAFVISLYHEGDQTLEVVSAIEYGVPLAELIGMRRSLDGSGLTGWMVGSRRTLMIDDLATRPLPVKPVQKGVPMRSWLGTPLIAHDRLVGAISIQSLTPAAYSEADRRLLESLATPVAVAIENARLYEEIAVYAAQQEVRVAERTAELQAANRSLEEAAAKLTELNRVKSQFVSNVSHELRTPLTNIRLLLNLLQKGRPDKQAYYFATITREADLLQALIEDLLTLSRLDLGTVQPHFELVDVSTLAGTLAQDRTALFAEHGLTLRTALTDGLAPIQADPKMLTQVLTNLLTNAMHYTPSGGTIVVATGIGTLPSRAPASSSDLYLWFAVRDTGPGISSDEQARLFERFFRGDASRQTRSPGTGLGLAICYEIVQRHHGAITVDSTLGQGSAFTVWLPVDHCPTNEAH